MEEANYSTIIQAWDFRPGGNFVLDMQKAAAEATRTIIVLSPDYLATEFTQPEWAAAFGQDPTGEKRILVPVRVRSCELQGLLSQIVYIDLVELPEEAAKETLLNGMKRERAKPSVKPGFQPAAGEPAAKTRAPRDENLSILLNNVRKIWVEDYLNSALLNAITIDLELREKQDAVPQPFEELNIRLRRPDQEEQDLPPGTQAIDIYHQTQGSLLILGQPGSGKTTTLATLARDLLAEAGRNPAAPVPVIFNLSSWAAAQKPLADWLEEELNRQYQVSRKLAQTWLAGERLALLLDGLDEVANEQREACVDAINTYHADTMGPLVVCSRLKDYEALHARLHLGQAIVLKKLTQPQVEQYFQRLAERQTDPATTSGLQNLCEYIFADDGLRPLTETPLMLNIITLTYSHPDAPALPQGEEEALRAQIFDAYSEHMFNRLGRTQVSLLHPKEMSLRYLRYLAAQLQAHDLTQFSIGQIRGSWLPAGRIRHRYHWLSRLSVRADWRADWRTGWRTDCRAE